MTDNWLILVKTRGGTISLLRCFSEAEAKMIFDRLNPMTEHGGTHPVRGGDVEHLEIIDPTGKAGSFMTTSYGVETPPRLREA